METAKIFEKIDELEEKYIKKWCEICNIESPSNYKEGVDAVGKYCTAIAEEFGWEVEVFPQEISGDAICITMNKDALKKPIVLSAHMDTVHPVGSFGENPTKIEDGKILGPGTNDCKGGIIAAFLTMEALSECGYDERPVKLVLQSDEEVGSAPSKKATVKFMAEKAEGCEIFLNCEGHGYNKLVIERKGITRYEIEVNGRAAHSSACYDGASAVCEAAHKVIKLEQWKDAGGITCNCGIISGGSTANSVPDKCSIIADFRYKKKEELDVIENFMKEVTENSTIEGTTSSFKQKSYRCPMERVERNEEAVRKLNEIFVRNGLEHVVAAESGGGSDAADMTSAGFTCVDSIGVSGGGLHSIREYAYISSLCEAAKRLAAAVNEI